MKTSTNKISNNKDEDFEMTSKTLVNANIEFIFKDYLHQL
jgi:hypothetical protein